MAAHQDCPTHGWKGNTAIALIDAAQCSGRAIFSRVDGLGFANYRRSRLPRLAVGRAVD